MGQRRHLPVLRTRRERVFLVLAGIFLTHALLAELLGGKLIEPLGRVMSIGVIPWPVVFVTTDLINEYYGPQAVRRLTILAVCLIAYSFCLLFVCVVVPAASSSPVADDAFRNVFTQSMWIIVGSLVAFVVGQLLDAWVFVLLRQRSSKQLWVRAVGSTVASQLVDSFVVTAIAFGLSGKLSPAEVFSVSSTNYVYKFVVAVLTLPVVYFAHHLLDTYLAPERQEQAG